MLSAATNLMMNSSMNGSRRTDTDVGDPSRTGNPETGGESVKTVIDGLHIPTSV